MVKSSLSFMCVVASVMVACSGKTHPKTVEPVDAGKDTGAEPKDSGTDAADATEAGGAAPVLITEPDQGMTPVYDFIKTAKHTLDMTMYELVDTTVTGLLTTAADSGVTVRVILDITLEKSENTAAYNALSASKVQVHWADTTYSATHQKTITVDHTTSAVMSLNLASEYYTTTRDFAVITTDAADVAAIETTFDADFTSAAITPPNGTDLVWSPTNSQGAILGLINGAKKSLIIENEEMSYDEVISALTSAAGRGVDVEVVMTGSKEWDSAFTTLTAAKVKVVTYTEDAPLYIHAKVILADYGTSTASVFIGSENFSDASLTRNRELGILFSDAAIMTAINTTLVKDFNGGTAYP